MTEGLGRSDRKLLGLILILALGSRIFEYTNVYVIHRDGIDFYNLASDFAEGRFQTGLDRSTFHPLYPMLMAAVGRGLHVDLEAAGYFVSIFFSFLTAIPLLVFGTRAFGKKIAFLGVFFFAINPIIIRTSIEVATEATYTFFFISAIALGWLALEKEKLRFHLLAGIAVFFAYMTRPEGFALMLPLTAWIFFTGQKPLREDWKRRIASIACLFLVFLVLAAPFLIHIHRETGGWNISRKPPVTSFIDDLRGAIAHPFAAEANEDSAWSRVPRSVARVSNALIVGVYPTFALLILMSLYRGGRTGRNTRAEVFFLTIFALYILFFIRVAAAHGYFSIRYLIPFIILLMLWAAVGTWEIREIILRSWERAKNRPEYFRKAIVVAAVVLGLVTCVPKTLRGYRPDEWGEREAGLWIKEHHPTGPAICTDLARVPHYAAGNCVRLPPGGYSEIVKFAKDGRIPYLVVADEKIDEQAPSFFSNVRPQDLQEIHSCPRSIKDPEGEQVIVYRVKFLSE